MHCSCALCSWHHCSHDLSLTVHTLQNTHAFLLPGKYLSQKEQHLVINISRYHGIESRVGQLKKKSAPPILNSKKIILCFSFCALGKSSQLTWTG